MVRKREAVRQEGIETDEPDWYISHLGLDRRPVKIIRRR